MYPYLTPPVPDRCVEKDFKISGSRVQLRKITLTAFLAKNLDLYIPGH